MSEQPNHDWEQALIDAGMLAKPWLTPIQIEVLSSLPGAKELVDAVHAMDATRTRTPHKEDPGVSISSPTQGGLEIKRAAEIKFKAAVANHLGISLEELQRQIAAQDSNTRGDWNTGLLRAVFQKWDKTTTILFEGR